MNAQGECVANSAANWSVHVALVGMAPVPTLFTLPDPVDAQLTPAAALTSSDGANGLEVASQAWPSSTLRSS